MKRTIGIVGAIALVVALGCGGRNSSNGAGDSGITGGGGIVNNPSNDTTAPTVTSFNPANGGNFAANAVLISVTFSEPINTSTVTTSSFHVKAGNTCTGTQLTSSAPVASNSNQTFTITLNASQLTATQQYSTCLTAAITDVAGNALTATSATWTASAVDTTPPGAVTGFTVQPALTRLILTWNNPGDADLVGVRILRKTSNDIGAWDDATATVACGGNIPASQTSCTDTGLTNGTTYYYKIFTYDAVPNYNSGTSGSGVPACGTIEDIRSLQGSPTTSNSRYSLSGCTLPQVTVTMVHRDGSNMGFYIQQTKNGAGIFVFTQSVNPTTTLNLTPGDRITFVGGAWADLCVASFNRQLQIVKKTGASVCDGTTSGYTAANFTTGDFTEGSANSNYINDLATTVSGNVTFSLDYTEGADGRLYAFTTPVSITGPLASGVFPASFGGSTTINVTNTALVASLLSNGIQFTPGRAVVGRYLDNLELRMYGTGAAGTTNHDGITPGGGENGYAIKAITYSTAPSVAFFSPANGGGYNVSSTSVSVGFDQAINPATVTSSSFKVVAGTDCAAAALATTGGITNSNGQKTFTLTLTGGQITDGAQYTTCVTTAIQNTSNIALASAQSATWLGSTASSKFADFESWATANQPTGWVDGTPPSGGSGAPGTTATNITQDTMTPVEGTRGANFNSPTVTGNGNILSYATTGSALAGSCSRIGLYLRGTSTGGRSISIQLQSAGSTAANYCNIGNDQLAASFSAATTIEPASAQYNLSDINTGGAWRAAVCRIDNLAGGAMDTFRIRVGNGGGYNITVDAIEFLDSTNNPCVPIDTAPPSVSSSSPANSATNVVFAASASVTFNKAMNASSVNSAYSVKETDCSGTTVSTGTPTASGGNTVFTYSLTNLKPSTVYAHCVTTAAQSSLGVNLPSAYSSTWTTAALTEPTGVSATPGDTQVSIAFTPGNGNGGVKIVYATGSAPSDCSGTAIYTGATSPYVHTGLTNGTTYYYRVCTTHNSGAYLSAGVTTSATPVNQFNVTGASSPSNTSVTVTFSHAPTPGTGASGAENAANYEIVLGASACGSGAVIATTAASLSGSTVTLTTASQSAVSYKVCVSNVTRSSDSMALTTNSATFTGTSGSVTIYSFTDWTANATAGVYPSNMSFGCTQTLDPTLGATVSGTYSGATNVGALSFGVRGEGAGGISLLNTGTANAFCNYGAGNGFMASIDVNINTTGRTNIRVSWSAAQISDQPREHGLRLQYDCGSGFTDAAGPVEFLTSTAGTSTAYFNFGPTTLPAACENNATAKLRWRYYYISGTGNRTRIAIDEILVQGD